MAFDVSRFVPWFRHPLFWVLVMVVILALGTRVWGPSALFRFDQPRTVHYTSDIVVNGNWLLPRDVEGHPATKPPLVNWMSAPLVGLGFFTEWAVKAPRVFFNLLTVVVIILMTYWLLRRARENSVEVSPGWAQSAVAAREEEQAARGSGEVDRAAMTAGLLAGIFWLTTPGGVNILYHCRPDAVMNGFLALAWAAATLILVSREPVSDGWRWLLWIATGFAALAKGPPALLIVLYVILGSKLMRGRWGFVRETGIAWGLPVMLLIPLAWAVPAALLNWDHFYGVLIRDEMVDRVTGERFAGGGSWWHLLVSFPTLLDWYATRFLPWSILAILAVGFIAPWRWGHHVMGACVLWVVVNLGFFGLSIGKTADYLVPSFTSTAPLAAWLCVYVAGRYSLSWLHLLGTAGVVLGVYLLEVVGLIDLANARLSELLPFIALGIALLSGVFALIGGVRLRPWFFATVAVIFCSLQGYHTVVTSSAARKNMGEHVREFAVVVEEKVGDEKIVFWHAGYNTLQFFLGYHQTPTVPTPEMLAVAEWVITPKLEGPEPVLLSEAIRTHRYREDRTQLGLYRMSDAEPFFPPPQPETEKEYRMRKIREKMAERARREAAQAGEE